MVIDEANPSELPLVGTRVLDLTRYVAGSYATMVLAALGADVIKIEDVHSGDPYREQGTARIRDASLLFVGLNVGKRSVSVDLKSDEGRTVVDRLLGNSDFLVENSRPGSLAKFDLDYHSVRARFPRVIYVSISGYGVAGPEAATGGFDLILQAESGIMSVTGEAEGPPTKVGTPFLDIGAGLSAVTGALAALQTRHRTGRGSHVTSSLLSFGLATFTSIVPSASAVGDYPTRLGSHSPTFAPYGAFRTSDGYVVLAGAGNERLWRELCDCLELSGLPDDARFATNADRVANREELTRLLESTLMRQTTSHWMNVLGERGVPVANVRALDEVESWDQVADMRLLETLESQDGEHYLAVNPSFTVNGALRYRRPAPLLGQHTAEVLREARLTDTEIADLIAMGAVKGEMA